MPIILLVLAIMIAAPCANAQGETKFVSFPFFCDATAAGLFADSGSVRGVAHQVLNFSARRTVQLCENGDVAWDQEPPICPPPRFVPRVHYEVWSGNVVCRGGIMSVAQISVHAPPPLDLVVPAARQYTLSGQSLVVTFTDSGVFHRNVFPPGWGPLPLGPLTWDLPPVPMPSMQALLSKEVPVTGTAPGPLRRIDSIFFDAAPLPQWSIAALMFASMVLASFGGFHNPGGFMHPQRKWFWAAVLLIGIGLWRSTIDPNLYAAQMHTVAQEQVRQIEADKNRVAQIIHVRNGYIEPLAANAVYELRSLLAVHQILDTSDLGQPSRLYNGTLIGAVVAFFVGIIDYSYAGYYYLFRKPPVVAAIRPALHSGEPIPRPAMREAMHAAAAPPVLAAVDDADIKHLHSLARDVAADAVEREHATGRSTALPLPDTIRDDPNPSQELRNSRRARVLIYLKDMILRRERALAAELDARRHPEPTGDGTS